MAMRHPCTKRVVICLLCFLLGVGIICRSLACMAANEEVANPARAGNSREKDAVVARQSLLENLEIKYKQEIYSFPVPGMSAGPMPEGTVVANGLVSTTECEFRRNGDRVMLITEPTGISKEPGEQFTPSRIVSYSGNRVEQLNAGRSGSIRPAGRLEDHVIDVAFGLRAKNMGEFLSPESWRSMVVRADGASVSFTREPMETSGDVLTQDTWRFDSSNSMALTEYVREWRSTKDNTWKTDVVVKMSDFEIAHDVLLPRAITAQQFFTPQTGQPHLVRRVEIAVDRISLGTVDGSEEAFLLTWPKDSRVLDTRSGRSLKVSDAPTKLTETAIADSVGKMKIDKRLVNGNYRLWLVVSNLLIAGSVVIYLVLKSRLSKTPS
jgi:hypothetical protein